MFNGNSPSLADIAAVTGNNKDGWGDGNGWWVLIILFAIFGGWGNGFGGGYGNGGDRASVPCATQADVRAAVDQQTLISKLDQQTYGLADSNYALNNTINSNFRTLDNSIWTLGFKCYSSFRANEGYDVQYYKNLTKDNLIAFLIILCFSVFWYIMKSGILFS